MSWPFAIFLAYGRPRTVVPAAWAAAAVGVLVALPWFVRSWIVLGNPLFPLATRAFGSGWADAEAVRTASRAVLEQMQLPQGANA